ncbi:discoidin domain-containing protein [Mangrovihabitans endophyticus]|uniref:discoidin domain-containing protein n=1 Tax=Mangrovihabitans endophyticus TaxID=1751298 RepID=UPI00166BBAB4|nr:discoidin domain-containing protein [Mangrovihabitans endophyticus]
MTPTVGKRRDVAWWSKPHDDAVADTYRHVLHLHTRWVQAQWDSALGAYAANDFRFVSVLGNAVLLVIEDYDEDLAGVSRRELEERTLATVKRFAATNRLAGGREWGRQMFWDSTYELYFVLAARLLWDRLDAATRTNVQRIATGQAAYAYGLNHGDDPLSESAGASWTTNGVEGGWLDDSKLGEMGVYAQALAPGLVWADSPGFGWRDRFLFWMANLSGLPAADRANAARLDGLPVRERAEAHNIYDTFIVAGQDAAGRGAADPYLQAEVWRVAARTAIHFLVAGKALPQLLTHAPNGEQLWRTLKLLATDAGEPVMPMAGDHYHRYGCDVLPLAFLAQVRGDRYAARAEADLAARLTPYLRYAPQYRLTKLAGEESREPQARAELAIAYLLHRHRGSAVTPVSRDAFFADAAGTRDFGTDVGLTVQQTSAGVAAAVSKEGFIRFLWQPRHDNWLIDTRAAGFLPAGSPVPVQRWTRALRRVREGVDATATVFCYGDRYAGFVTLPTGTVIYASSGIGRDEGMLTLFNRNMPGIPGMSGERAFTCEGGKLTLSGSGGGGGDGGTDELIFKPRPARYVRMLGREASGEYGYSLWTFSVLDEAGADLAQGAMPIASSSDVTYPARNATDGNPQTRWAVDRGERGRSNSWLAVDLGSTVTVAGVRLEWQDAYGARYLIQTSTDALTWTDAVSVPQAHTLSGRWVDIDGRAGLVTHGGSRPITVTATGVIAATGDLATDEEPEMLVVEGYARRGVDLAAAAARRMPEAPPGMLASDADGHLAVFNFQAERSAVEAVRLPSKTRLYRGTQEVRPDCLEWMVTVAGGAALVEPPRFTVEPAAPVGTRFVVADSHHVRITAPRDQPVRVRLHAGNWSTTVQVAAGRTTKVAVDREGPRTPTTDLARAAVTFPTSPLPEDMTAPDNAVDGDARTAWRPGTSGRMVVDTGHVYDVAVIRLTWTDGRRRPVRVEHSTDGLTYTLADRIPEPARVAVSPMRTSARYVAVVVDGWRPGDAELAEFAVFPSAAD